MTSNKTKTLHLISSKLVERLPPWNATTVRAQPGPEGYLKTMVPCLKLLTSKCFWSFKKNFFCRYLDTYTLRTYQISKLLSQTLKVVFLNITTKDDPKSLKTVNRRQSSHRLSNWKVSFAQISFAPAAAAGGSFQLYFHIGQACVVHNTTRHLRGETIGRYLNGTSDSNQFAICF